MTSASGWPWAGATSGPAGSTWPSTAWKRRCRIRPGEALLRYNLACYLSLAGRKRRALRYLSQAMALDPVYREMAEEEADFDPLRADPEFQAILTARSCT